VVLPLDAARRKLGSRGATDWRAERGANGGIRFARAEDTAHERKGRMDALPPADSMIVVASARPLPGAPP
jgi:hypothetical protein